MRPFNDFRNWLKQLREIPEARDNVRRDNSPGIGPFNSGTRERFLKTADFGEEDRSNTRVGPGDQTVSPASVGRTLVAASVIGPLSPPKKINVVCPLLSPIVARAAAGCAA